MNSNNQKKINLRTSTLIGAYKTTDDTKKKVKIGLALALLALISDIEDDDAAKNLANKIQQISGVN